jgi:RecA-family ATPase
MTDDIDWGSGFEEINDDPAELGEWDAGELLESAAPAPRQWLMSRQFCRGFLSGLVAPGAAGKTTLRLTQAIELAARRELLGHRIYQRCRVLVVSLEDDREELHRRLTAICLHHRINPAELKGPSVPRRIGAPRAAWKRAKRAQGGRNRLMSNGLRRRAP